MPELPEVETVRRGIAPHLEGARIVLFLDDERARCEGAEGAPCRLVVDGTALR